MLVVWSWHESHQLAGRALCPSRLSLVTVPAWTTKVSHSTPLDQSHLILSPHPLHLASSALVQLAKTRAQLDNRILKSALAHRHSCTCRPLTRAPTTHRKTIRDFYQLASPQLAGEHLSVVAVARLFRNGTAAAAASSLTGRRSSLTGDVHCYCHHREAAHESFVISLEQLAQHVGRTTRLRQVADLEVEGYEAEARSIGALDSASPSHVQRKGVG